VLLASCQTPQLPSRGELLHRGQPILGTFVTISACGSDRAQLDHAILEAFAEIRRIDGLMSLHRSDSELSKVNALAAREPVSVSSDLFRVLVAAQEVAARTEGAFDITIRPLADLWGFIWKEYRLPTEVELRRILPSVDYRLVHLDSNDRSVRFLAQGVSLDLGGIAKGFAVDCAIEKLRSLGVTNAMVKAGGDLRVIGAPPGERGWEVQLEDPGKRGRRIAIPLRDAALSTSGNYENYFIVQGRRYSHILDPRTGFPVQGIAACTVIRETCMESDAWATASFVYGAERSFARFGRECPMRFTLAPTQESGAMIWPVLQNDAFPRPR
jgi:thiamine biosynthesis lipoprotein